MVNRKQKPRAIDAAEPCFVRMRLEQHGPYLPARIFKRLGLLCAEINNVAVPVDSVWMSGDRISETEWLQLTHDRKRAKPF